MKDGGLFVGWVKVLEGKGRSWLEGCMVDDVMRLIGFS